VGSILKKVEFLTHCGLQNRRRAPAKSYSTWYGRIDVPFHKVNQDCMARSEAMTAVLSRVESRTLEGSTKIGIYRRCTSIFLDMVRRCQRTRSKVVDPDPSATEDLAHGPDRILVLKPKLAGSTSLHGKKIIDRGQHTNTPIIGSGHVRFGLRRGVGYLPRARGLLRTRERAQLCGLYFAKWFEAGSTTGWP
jgi:hypothetical protein